jgi:hypothetical protein
MANAPPTGQDGIAFSRDLPDDGSEIFLRRGLDGANHLESAGENRANAHAPLAGVKEHPIGAGEAIR